MSDLPGYDDWLDNHGNPGIIEPQCWFWDEACHYEDVTGMGLGPCEGCPDVS